jgi:hypothetical protein
LIHPIRFDKRAARDIEQAREWHDARDPGLGDKFVARVNETLDRIEQNPYQYPVRFLDARRADLHQFRYGLWYRIQPDHSVLIACLSHRQEPAHAIRRTFKPEP